MDVKLDQAIEWVKTQREYYKISSRMSDEDVALYLAKSDA